MTVENAYKIKEFYEEPEEKIVSPQSVPLPAGCFTGRLNRIRHLRQRLLPRRPRRRGRAGGMDESSIKSKNIPTIFLYVTGEWPGLFLLFHEPALNTNGTYG